MGHLKFGNLAYIRNIVYVRLSPFEQNPFANWAKNCSRGVTKDFKNNAPYIIPTMLATYLIIDWGNKEHARSMRKNPKDFENDV